MTRHARASLLLLAALGALACGSSSSDAPGTTGTSGNAGTTSAGSSGASGATTGGSGGSMAQGGTSAAGAAGTSAAGSAGAAGSVDTCPPKLSVPSVPDMCAKDTDCVLVTSLKECCGPVAYATPAASAAAWNTAAAAYNACSCPDNTACFQDGTRAEDNTTPGETPPVARCLQGVCVASYVASCAAPPVANERACESAQDCAAALVATSCCANQTFGVRKTSADAFSKAWAQYGNACRGQCLTGCFPPPPTADDGSMATSSDQQPTVACVGKVCTSSFAK